MTPQLEGFDTDAPIDDIAFLARSENRVKVLEALTTAPHTRDDLTEQTGVSRVTLGRTLGGLNDRGWIVQRGRDYESTPLGELVVEKFVELVETMATEHRLRSVMQWFPTDQITFDIRCLSDAEIVFPTESDPTAPIRRAGEQVRAGTRLRFLTTQVTVSYFDSVRETAIHNDMTVEGVATPEVYDTLVNDASMADVYQDLHDSDDAAFFVTDNIPLILQIIDSAVGVGLVDGARNPQGLILSNDETVHRWAVDTFETYRERAEVIDPATVMQ